MITKKKNPLMMIKTVQNSGSILAQVCLPTTPLILPSQPWVRSLLSPSSLSDRITLCSFTSHFCQVFTDPLNTRLIPIQCSLAVIPLPIIPLTTESRTPSQRLGWSLSWPDVGLEKDWFRVLLSREGESGHRQAWAERAQLSLHTH